MNIYFCGIGGVGLGPLAEIAVDAGYTVIGSDPKESLMTQQMRDRGVDINADQSGAFLQSMHDARPIDWFVYTSALPVNHPELVLAKKIGIKTSKRDELLAHIIEEKGLKLIAIAGTHGKTGTTAMAVWTFKQLGIPISYSIGTTLSFGPSGQFNPDSDYFVYECDEYDRNFLSFHPFLALITALSYDHPDTYPRQKEYDDAFTQFARQSQSSILWQKDANQLGPLKNAWLLGEHDVKDFKLVGTHYRENASLVAKAFEKLEINDDITEILNRYPGVDRRFEKLADNIYTDYAIHPKEIAATLKLARELNDDIVLVYQPHQNVRQHAVRNEYADTFELASDVYWLPTYLTREDPTLAILTSQQLTQDIVNHDAVHISELDDDLWENVQQARDRGALVLFMGAGSIDGWVRKRLERKNIETIIFDVGGVLIGDYSTTWKDVQTRVHLDEHTFRDIWMDIVKRFGSGKMSEQDVWDELAHRGAPHVSTDENIMGTPFKETLIIYEDVMNQARRLQKKGFQIAILSNTIAPHASVLRDMGIYAPFGDNVFLSQEIGIRKPSVEAYRYTIDHLGVRSLSSAIFIDDRLENLAPAIELGMQTYHVKDIDSLVKMLEAL